MKLWLDDIRPAPEGWVWVKTIDEAKPYLEQGVSHASLDNDLGEAVPEGRKLVYWMAENGIWPSDYLYVHSANPVARDYMVGMMHRYAPESLAFGF